MGLLRVRKEYSTMYWRNYDRVSIGSCGQAVYQDCLINILVLGVAGT